jgi:hypothetical protein
MSQKQNPSLTVSFYVQTAKAVYNQIGNLKHNHSLPVCAIHAASKDCHLVIPAAIEVIGQRHFVDLFELKRLVEQRSQATH